MNIVSDFGNRLFYVEYSDGCEFVLVCEVEKDDCVEVCISLVIGFFF